MPPIHRAAPRIPPGPAANDADAHDFASDRAQGELFAAADKALSEWSLSPGARLDPDEVRRARDLALRSQRIRIARLRSLPWSSGETG
jgi:hypothetical protein